MKVKAQENPVYILAAGLLESVFFIPWSFLPALISDLQGYNESSADLLSLSCVVINKLTLKFVVLIKYPC